MGIDLSNSVVIFDEAHNLVEAVNHIYSADVSYSQLDLASHSVAEYSMRFQSTLTGKNYYYVTLLLSVIKSLLQCLKADKNDTKTVSSTPLTANIPGTGSKVLGANDFLFSCGLDNVNMFKLRKHITDTNLVNKVGGYAEHQAKKRAAANAELAVITLTVKNKNRKNNHHNSSLEGNKTASSSSASSSSSSVPSFSSSASATAISSENKASSEGQDYTLGGYTHALRGVLALITCLTNADIDGRIVINTGTNTDKGTGKSASIPSEGSNADNSINSSTSSIRFILLNPSVHFQKIVDKARSVLLLGGTLRPFAYLKSFLFPRVSTDKIILFACGHVVSKKNVLSLVASCGPKGNNLEFTHDTRLQANSLSELHCALKEINKVVPNGVVVFFASYQYMGSVIAKWKALGVYGELESGRPLYTEPRHASDADNVWVEYSKKAVAEGGPGAMLFCVMGGKLSEGINFSDKLARCVVVIGMPYPDGRDTVLREKLKFANIIENDEKAGNRLYEAMCMRTVNQCIGRSIRHVNDYAAIVLLDTRYSQQRVNAQLPIWLNSDVAHCTSFSSATFKLRTFFASHLT